MVTKVIKHGEMITMMIITTQVQVGIVTTKKIITHGEIITTIILTVAGIQMVIIIKEEMTSGIRIKPVIQIITPEVGIPTIQEITTITVVGTPMTIQIQIGIITTIIVAGVPKIK